MVKIINIRGANGAGKTSLVRAIMRDRPQQEVLIGDFHVPGHWLYEDGIVIVGPYVEGKATGGMDNVNTTEMALDAVEKAARGAFRRAEGAVGGVLLGPVRAVVFEGILISTVYKTWLEFSRDVTSNRPGREVSFAWAFLPTSAAQCVERVKQRRAAKGRPEEGFKEDLVMDKHASISRVREKALSDAQVVLDLPADTEDARSFLLDYINEGA